ncbi:hypothetical protein F503_03791 [Ophiostoma piceae UAMH 11346]|uniref:AA1-like domain-containing protein n=1 Tax=Ophiostoma piceae (strain UAMH 11346) TaxID=1262450 RepID=S3C0G9_OPHP1|nr:hypothetical protein F503_03791 [Ophiostoma piceae UAMH 11346]
MVRMIAPVVGLLAAGAAAVPTARDSTCSSLSQTDFKWSVSDLQYNSSVIFSTPAHQIDNGVIQFNISNPAFPGKAASICTAYSTRPNDFFYGDQVFTCNAGIPEGGLTTTFTYNAPSKTLALNQSWSCAGEQTSFTYEGSVDLSSKLKCQNEEYTNPKWSIGETYTSNTTTCTAADFEWTPSSGSAVAK